MHPVAPSTIVRGPAALTISFITSADSQPWQVRCPEVKYSSMVTRLTPRNGVRICVALSNVCACVSAIGWSLLSRLFAHAQPGGLERGLTRLRRLVAHVGRLVDVLERHLAAAEAADERDERRPAIGVVERGADLVGDHAGAERRAEGIVAVDDADRLGLGQGG